eukprot:GILK01009436.1.p1 GENE.GILK01009436.1~~GILK01009436.1.p1  ORF type:complete len:819 (-),score=144.85 GILK01009436.1:231-2645(-)
MQEHRDGNGQSYWNQLTSNLPDIASLLPAQLKDVTSFGRAPRKEVPRDTVTWTHFQYVLLGQQRRLCLLLGYMNGFSVWDVHDPKQAQELMTKRDVPIRCGKFLDQPVTTSVLPESGGALSGCYPLVALVSGVEQPQFSRSVVKIYSLPKRSFVHILRFRSEVLSIATSELALVVATADKLEVVNARELQVMFTLNGYPTLETSFPPMALGSRWLAYASGDSFSTAVNGFANGSNGSSSPSDSLNTSPTVPRTVIPAGTSPGTLADVARSGLQYLGDVGRKTFSNYLGNGPAPQPADNTRTVGVVMVRDIVTKQVVCCFKAHNSPVSVLAFDPSGTLLASASESGHHVHIYRLFPCTLDNQDPPSFRPLYKLVRGITQALMFDVSFSVDSRWVAVSSVRGTTHLYAIHPNGGSVGGSSHVAPSVLPLHASPPLPQYLLDMQTPDPLSLYVVDRIKHGSFLSSQDVQPKTFWLSPGSIGLESSHPPLWEGLYTVTAAGILTLHRLIPSLKLDNEAATGTGESLQLQIELSRNWEVSRVRDSSDRDCSSEVLNRHNTLNRVDLEPEANRWLSNVELHTFHQTSIPLHISPQFTFLLLEPKPAQTVTDQLDGDNGDDIFSTELRAQPLQIGGDSNSRIDSRRQFQDAFRGISESDLAAQLSKAMATPIGVSTTPQPSSTPSLSPCSTSQQPSVSTEATTTTSSSMASALFPSSPQPAYMPEDGVSSGWVGGNPLVRHEHQDTTLHISNAATSLAEIPPTATTTTMIGQNSTNGKGKKSKGRSPAVTPPLASSPPATDVPVRNGKGRK